LGEEAGVTTDNIKYFPKFCHCWKRITGDDLSLKEHKLVIIAEWLSTNKRDVVCFGFA
jgi:hypothetical protein